MAIINLGTLQNNRFFVSCDEIWEGCQGNPYSADGNREYQRNYLVRVRRKELGPAAVCLAPGLPLPGAIYITPFDYDLLARVTKLEAKQRDRDDWEAWIVTVTYSTRPNNQQQTQTPDNPENEPVQIDADFEIEQVALPHDMDGKPFMNSAYMPFTPAPTFPIACPVLNITRNELDYSITKATNFAFAINSKPFLGYPKDCVQCSPPKAKQMYRGTFAYAQVSYKLKFAPQLPTITQGGELVSQFRSFQPRLLDQGMVEYEPGRKDKNGNPIQGSGYFDIYTSLRQRVTQPVLLNGLGLQQFNADERGNLIPIFLQFRLYPEVDFAKLLVRGLGSLGIVQQTIQIGGGITP